MRVRLTPPANVELAEVLQSLSSVSPSGATRLVRRFDDLVAKLRDFPWLGQKTDEEGVRRANLHPYPYLVLYEVTGETVVVHAVRHGASRPDRLRVRPRP